ncbi:MAG: LysR family transcriptional regulator [Salaquimonas sp.]
MDINWLDDFVCFAKSMNFTKAAAERNITQSAFSRRIQSLEIWLGAELIDRKTFPATLSAAGEDFLPTAKRLLQTLHRTRDDIRARAGMSADTLRFAAPHSISIHNLMPILSKLETIIPDLKTKVISDNLHNCCEQLSEQNCDFLMCYKFASVPIMLDEQKFHHIEIGTDRLLPVYSPDSFSSKNWKLPGWDSPPMPYLQYSSGSFLGSVTEQIFFPKQPNLRVRHADSFSEALKSLCLQGAGLAWLPEASIVKEINEGKLIIAGDGDWCVDLKLVIYSEPDIHKYQSEVAWKFFSQMAL